jgi:hypothetical protein
LKSDVSQNAKPEKTSVIRNVTSLSLEYYV